ncbi:DUF6898 family protein [Azospirillum halopraeferens]|uniref:DUF6898 family protein n=1 Tax=Azospirillum halopraeferens TaxID=34010 RepID=UPI000400F927|nr:hypothetical protein [Azospirillum halopraeferens]
MSGFDENEVLFEFVRVGNYLKVSAIDPATAIEVSVAGPVTGSRELLKRTAVNKLRYVLERRRAEQGGRR